MINILELRSTYTTGGGPDKTILLSAQKHTVNRFNIIISYLKGINDGELEIANWAKEKKLNFEEIVEKGKIDINALKRLNELIRTNKIDIIHAHDYKTDVLAWVLSWFNKKILLLATAHGWIDNSKKEKFYNYLDMWVLRYYDKIIAVCEANKQKLINRGVAEDKIRVIYNGIDIEEWKDSEEIKDVRNELGIKPETKVIGYVGRLSPEKDLRTLLKAIREVKKEVSNIKVLIVGEGPSKEGLIDYARELKISSEVLFLGFRKDVKKIYKTIDILAMTSKTEGLSNTILEAQAMGKPVIATQVGGNSEIIEDNLNGFLFPFRHYSSLCEKIILLLKNNLWREKMGENARKQICKNFSFDQRLKKVEELYLEIMASKRQ